MALKAQLGSTTKPPCDPAGPICRFGDGVYNPCGYPAQNPCDHPGAGACAPPSSPPAAPSNPSTYDPCVNGGNSQYPCSITTTSPATGGGGGGGNGGGSGSHQTAGPTPTVVTESRTPNGVAATDPRIDPDGAQHQQTGTTPISATISITASSYAFTITSSLPTEKGANGEAQARCRFLQNCQPSIDHPNDWGDSEWISDYNKYNGNMGNAPRKGTIPAWPREVPPVTNFMGLTALSLGVPAVATAMNIAACAKGSWLGCVFAAIGVRGGRSAEPGATNTAMATVDDLSGGALSNYNRFVKNLPAAAETPTITKLADGALEFSAKVPAANIPGSYATYTKIVGPDGVTTSFIKTTIAPDGSIVHVKVKYP